MKEKIVHLKIFLIPLSSIIFIMLFSSVLPNSYGITTEGLQGNTIQTFMPWKLSDNRALTISITNSDLISQDKISAIKYSILSEDEIKTGDPQLHGKHVRSLVEYFKGWKGALEYASTRTSQFHIPTNFKFVESQKDTDITIDLRNSPNADLYSAYTILILKSDHVIKTHTIIYNVNEYSTDRLVEIVRHEFGHALGIGHSTDPGDLMYYLPDTDYPYISACDVDAIHSLYNGKESSNISCKK